MTDDGAHTPGQPENATQAKPGILPRLKNALVSTAFMSLAIRRIENIRVKYRPSGWYCHVPVVREVIGLFSRSCEPLQLASN